MSKSSLRMPSPAMAVALVALFVAIAGTAYAGVTLSKNSVGTKQLKAGAVTTSKLANKAVTAKKLNTKGVTVPNALHANTAGSATSAGTASLATNATTAANATSVDGQTIQKINWLVPANTSTQTIFSAIGLTITASCNSSGDPTVDATGPTATNTAELEVFGEHNGNTTPFRQRTFNFNSTSSTSLLNADATNSDGGAQLTYMTTTGHTASMVYSWDFNPSFGNVNVCTLQGEMIYS